MSLIDVDKDKLRKATFLFARKKTGSIVSSYETNAYQIAYNHRNFLGILRDYYNNENNKFNPDALPYNNISRILYSMSGIIHQNCV